MDWHEARAGTPQPGAQPFFAAINLLSLLLLDPTFTLLPHEAPLTLDLLQEDHSHFPHACIPFPKLRPDTTQRQLGNMFSEGDYRYIPGPEVQLG